MNFQFRTIAGLGLLIVLAVSLRGQGAATNDSNGPPMVLSLNEVIAEVLTNNPSLKVASANWEAMKERIPQARAWKDPRLDFQTRAARFIGVPQNSFVDQSLVAEQALPISGRNRLGGDAATAEAASAWEEFRRKQLNAVAKAKSAYYRLANSYEQLDVNGKNLALLKQFSEISRAKLESGMRSQADVLGADTELAKLGEATFDFEREISEATTTLNTLMNRPPQTPVGTPGKQAFEPVELSLTDLERIALANRPEVIIAERKVEATKFRLAAARKEWIPEPSLRIAADRYNDSSQAVSELDAGFSIDLPWFNRAKYRAEVSENRKLLESAQHELEAVRSETLGLVVDQFTKVRTFHHHTVLYQSKLLPLARASIDAQRADYASNKAGFLEVLTAQQTAQDTESMYWEHLMHYQIELAELESLIGANLPAAGREASPIANEK